MRDESTIGEELKAPFPYFGGKRRVAHLVWERFGDVSTYNEPFAGSLAVLLGRPHPPRVETVNDVDCFLANFWRALQHDPDGVAYWADAPVNEADLHARHRWLVWRGRRLVLRCMRDPHYFNAKIAGWWVWGQCLWIGSGWCQIRELRTDGTPRQKLPYGKSSGQGVVSTTNWTGRANAGRRPPGVHAARVMSNQKRPGVCGNGESGGVHRRWQGGGQGGGSGVHAPTLWRQKPDMSGDSGATGRGIHASAMDLRTGGLYDYMHQLAARLRRVRVCCGDWKRVLTPSVTTYIGTCGVFLDPPYAHELRERCYAEDHDISADVRQWAIEHGDDPNMRIALCGYEGEHEMPDSWACVPWKAHGGYSRSERGVANRERERIWFSPHCLKPELPLFAGHSEEVA